MFKISVLIIILIIPIYSQPAKINYKNDPLDGHRFLDQNLLSARDNKNAQSALVSRLSHKQHNTQSLTKDEIFYHRNLNHENYPPAFDKRQSFVAQSAFLSDSLSLNWRTPYLENPTRGYEVLIDMVIDSIGNSYHLISSTYLPHGMEICLLKYDPDGNELWASRFGTSLSEYTYPSAIAVDNFNNIYICGYTMPYVESETDMFIAHFDKDGDLKWSTTFNSHNNDIDVAKDIDVDSNNDIIVTGLSKISDGNYQMVTIKYSNYKMIWIEYYNDDLFEDLLIYYSSSYINCDHDGNYVITHNTYYNGLGTIIKYTNSGQQFWSTHFDEVIPSDDFDILNIPKPALDSNANIYITLSAYYDYKIHCITTKFNGDGNIIWSNILYEDEPNQESCEPLNINLLDNGKIYICGIKYCGSGNCFLVVNYDSLGNELWIFDDDDKVINGIARILTLDKNEDIYIAGYNDWSYEKTVIAKLDSSGHQIWKRTENFGIDPIKILSINDGKFFLAGTLREESNKRSIFYLYNSIGTVIYKNEYIGPGRYYNIAQVLKIDHSNNIITAGYTVDENGNSNILIVQFNNKGMIKWSKIYKSTIGGDLDLSDISVDKWDNIYLTGKMNREIFVMKCNSAGVQLWQSVLDRPDNCSIYGAQNIISDNVGNIYITGFKWCGDGGYCIVTKYNSNGQLEWINDFAESEYDYFYYDPTYMNFDLDGNVVIAGSRGFADYKQDVYKEGAFVLKINPSGKIIWEKELTDEFGDFYPEFFKSDDLGNILMIYGIQDIETNSRVEKLKKINLFGEILWESTISNDKSNYYYANKMQIDGSGNIYILAQGILLNDYVDQLIKINSKCNVLWVTDIANNPQGLTVDKKGNSYITFENGILNKYNTNGALRWSESLQIDKNMTIDKILLTDSVNIVICMETNMSAYSYFEILNFKQHLSSSEFTEVATVSSGSWLNQNFPNPFNGITHFRYSITKPGNVSIKVFNMLGQHVDTILNERQDPKEYVAHWIPGNVPSGTYLIQLNTKGYTKTKKVCYIK